MPSVGFVVQKNLILEDSAVELSGVTVTANRATQHIDHVNYTFSSEQIRASRHAADLMQYVGSLTTDPISGDIKKTTEAVC